MTKRKVYISGPISNGGTDDMHAQRSNVESAIPFAQELLEKGYAVLLPHLTYFMDLHQIDNGKQPNPHDVWLAQDKAWVIASDAVLRLVGTSKGADQEVAWAREADIPVFVTVEALVEALPPEGPQETTFEEAQRLCTGDRNRDYHDPREDFARTAGMLSALFTHKLKEGASFEPSDVGRMMACVKLSRTIASPKKRDHYTDGEGYFGCAWRCESGEW